MFAPDRFAYSAGKIPLIEQEDIQTFGEQPSALQYPFVRQSLYFDAVKSYLDVFGPANVRIYHFTDVTKNLPMILKDLEAFLSVPLSLADAMDSPKNSFRAPRSQAASKLLAFYHTLSIKPLVNQITPRKLRNFVSTWFLRLNSKDAAKPPLSDLARTRILELIGDDYPRTLQLARDRGSLFEMKDPRLTNDLERQMKVPR